MTTTELIDLQTLNYRETWAKQEFLMEKLKAEKRTGKASINYLLLVEHPHIYTLGRNGNKQNLLINTIQLKAKDAEFIHVDRGGDITYHGYGQIVAYPVIRLDVFKMSVKEYVFNLEEVIIKTISHYNLKGERQSGAIGVWLDTDKKNARKICAIGIRCSEFVTMHGFALNVNTDLNYFNYINPCGFIDKDVTSIEKETGSKKSLNEVKNIIASNFETVFGMKFTNITCEK